MRNITVGFQRTDIEVNENADVEVICVVLFSDQVLSEDISVEIRSNDLTAVSKGLDPSINFLVCGIYI